MCNVNRVQEEFENQMRGIEAFQQTVDSYEEIKELELENELCKIEILEEKELIDEQGQIKLIEQTE